MGVLAALVVAFVVVAIFALIGWIAILWMIVASFKRRL